MFELPNGTPVTDDITLEAGRLQPFSYGVISTWLGRRKTPAGHRLVRAGRIVGWLVEGSKYTQKKDLLVGAEAREALESLENAEKVRHTATQYTLQGLGQIANLIPEAFEHQTDRQGLGSVTNFVERLLARDLSEVLRQLCEDPTVRGAIAVDAGMLIDQSGELPSPAEHLATRIQSILEDIHIEDVHMELGFAGSGHWTLHTNNGSLLLAQSGDIALAVWTEIDANHARLISSASIALEGEIGAVGEHGSSLPNGFTLREGRGGPDAVMSMLKASIEEDITGHIQAGASSKAVSLILSRGVPVALWAPSAKNLDEAMTMFTEPKRVLKLNRFDAGTIVSSKSGTIESFGLGQFCETLATIRTRSDARRNSLSNQLTEMLGFEIGIESLRKDRAKVVLKTDGVETSKGLPVVQENAVAAVDAGLQRRLEAAEQTVEELRQTNHGLESKIKALETKSNAAQIVAREANESRQIHSVAMEEANAKLNSMQVDLAESRNRSEDAESRAERLVRRVNELEHQVSERASELAKALGEAESSAKLHEMIETLALKEAELQANLSEGGERLSTVRQQSDDEERRLRVLTEQVNATRERHARSQADVLQLQEQIHVHQMELEAVKNDERSSRKRMEEDRLRLSEDEARRANIQAELRELMDERRTLLRELGDMGARRGHAEAELSSLVEKATALAEAHEEALVDIQEAERLRARLAEEPLAQALLDDNNTFEGLGPVLERLEHARSLGYSVTMLDRAVERALQVIQSTVDHVAATPRHLLSSEVMTLLERQVPQTAGAVRGLARWSVQQRLEHQLGETVNHVVLDLEHLLEDYDRSITMLRRIRNVLEQVERLGAPEHEIQALLSNCQRPESLPRLAQGTRKLIQVALDDIYLEADRRDAGEAIGLEETARVLEELITQLDASGLTNGVPRGMLWDFQRDGLLPFERSSIPAGQRLPVSEEMMQELESSLIEEEVLESIQSETKVPVDDEGWSELPAPSDNEVMAEVKSSSARTTAVSMDVEGERAELEAELARLDAAWSHRDLHPSPTSAEPDSALAELESRLSNVEF
ncbi:MAG: hypothetical protein L7S56_07700 [Candidatus Poseidonia sp.]|nr:hypothetical protein [Poseidonia sp.]